MANNNNQLNEIEWGGIINEFLWLCCGVNRKVLRQCPTEYAKYAAQGGLILFTAIMAALSGGYAFSTIFESKTLAFVFGIFWGLIIFYLDRFIVNTMYSDGKYTISWGEFRAGLPRIIIAIFLGIVISTPLEMKIFDDRIQWQITKDNEARMMLDNNNQDVQRKNNWQKQLSDLQKQENELQKIVNEASKELTDEATGEGGTGKIGHGNVYKDKLKRKIDAENALNDFKNRNKATMEYLQKQIRDTETIIDEQMASRRVLGENKGFCVRYEAFSNVKKANNSVNVVSIFITLLFIIIEVMPTFLKMMTASGPYDDMLRAEMYRIRILADKQISDINDEVNTLVKISTQKNESKMEAELQANKELIEKVAQVQAELLQTALEGWRQEELEKIKQNPSAYIQTTNTQQA